MIEPRHSLPDTEIYTMITDPNNPYGVQESQYLANWSNVYSIGWIRGNYYKAWKLATALRSRGWSDDEIKKLIAETEDKIDYRCIQQYNMLTGLPKELKDCGSVEDEQGSTT